MIRPRFINLSLGGHNCSCYDWFNGTNCQTYNPRRHCSDLQLYDGQTNSGVYSIFPYGPNVASIDVICDMDSQGGGWTIVSQVADNNAMFFSGKAMQDYKSGFGSARDGSVWLGLDNLYRVTSIVSMSLKVSVEQCSTTSNGTLDSYCIYPKFSIDGQTRAIIPQAINNRSNI
ncbi:hypothetical protein WR25_27217 [Diploscapter pachys]|uniref:Fibrinogen C-terminal domain-containing protein n=1 Tax=Diploscapter pachys TaxID=2018661 RepID=A0A2A2M389_9BILA|nr:hypothetical protein WR25_27217 [Diploscapter pachys]